MVVYDLCCNDMMENGTEVILEEPHSRFMVSGITQKLLRIFDTSFLKMMVKVGAIEIVFKYHELF